MPLLRAALGYASRGRPVFPLEPRGKRPLTTHGCRDATADEAQIQAWWKRWPAANIGLATGRRFAVLDVDGAEGYASIATLEAEHGALPGTLACITARGEHRWFTTPEVISNRAGLRPGLDARGEGGYVVAPPSIHMTGHVYRWRRAPLAEAPAWLLALLRRQEVRPRPAPAARPVGQPSTYGFRALEAEAARVAEAAEGTRNHTLNRAAFRLAQLVAGGELERADVEAALQGAAARCGLGEHEATRTIESGLNAGVQYPRSAPPRTRKAA